MIYYPRMFIFIIYVFSCFGVGVLISIIRPFNPNNVYFIGSLLKKHAFKILGIDFEKRNETIPRETYPVVFMSNHQNNLDLFTGGATIKPRTVLVGKKSIIWIPVFGQFFALSGNFLIDRKNSESAKKSMLEITKKIVDEKLSIWIMPEGTRSRGRGLLPFKKGGFITAINAQVPIVPVVCNSYAKTVNLSKIRSGKIIAKILDPINTKGLTLENLDELMKKTHLIFENTIAELDKEISQT